MKKETYVAKVMEDFNNMETSPTIKTSRGYLVRGKYTKELTEIYQLLKNLELDNYGFKMAERAYVCDNDDGEVYIEFHNYVFKFIVFGLEVIAFELKSSTHDLCVVAEYLEEIAADFKELMKNHEENMEFLKRSIAEKYANVCNRKYQHIYQYKMERKYISLILAQCENEDVFIPLMEEDIKLYPDINDVSSSIPNILRLVDQANCFEKEDRRLYDLVSDEFNTMHKVLEVLLIPKIEKKFIVDLTMKKAFQDYMALNYYLCRTPYTIKGMKETTSDFTGVTVNRDGYSIRFRLGCYNDVNVIFLKDDNCICRFTMQLSDDISKVSIKLDEIIKRSSDSLRELCSNMKNIIKYCNDFGSNYESILSDWEKGCVEKTENSAKYVCQNCLTARKDPEKDKIFYDSFYSNI